MKLQCQTYLGCPVSLNCMWSHRRESEGKEGIPMLIVPHHARAPSLRCFKKNSKTT